MENNEGEESFGYGRIWEPIDDQGSDQGKSKARPKGNDPRPKRAIAP